MEFIKFQSIIKKIYEKSKNFHQIFNIGRGKSEKLMDFINDRKNLKLKVKKFFNFVKRRCN